MTLLQVFKPTSSPARPRYAATRLKKWARAAGPFIYSFCIAWTVAVEFATVGGGTFSTASGVGCLVGSVVMILQAALLRAAGKPALWALACLITAICLAVAALTWRVIKAHAMLAFGPFVAAGQCIFPPVC